MALMIREHVTMRLRSSEPLHLFLQGRDYLLGTGSSPKSRSRLSEVIWLKQVWKERYGYHKRSLSEAAMIKALNKLTGLGMPETCRID
ncbi:transposase [Vibrio crassostreae]|nr:hypothetical protein EDB36_107119 [Vibrio crassostreae]CAK3506804.1 transposase [Vibrio crassostreae]